MEPDYPWIMYVLLLLVAASIFITSKNRNKDNVSKTNEPEDTSWFKDFMIPLPGTVAVEFFCRRDERPTKVWANRKNKLLIIDSQGSVWYGYIMPEMIAHILAFNYERKEYHVPVRGQGECEAGKPFTVDGYPIVVYPSWFNEDTPINEWRKLKELEEKQRTIFRGSDPETLIETFVRNKERLNMA